MKFNRLILISLLVLLISLGVVSATNNVNSTDESGALAVQTTPDFNNDLSIEDDISKVKSDDITNDEILKEESNSIIITNKTFSNYFDKDGKLLDSVDDGSVLDFQGPILASDNIKGIYINKSVNVISSTGDAIIMLNSSNGNLGKESIAGRFVVDSVSSINIENMTFNGTQLLIYDSNNVILKNSSILSNFDIALNQYPDDRGVGFVRLSNLTNVVVEYNYFNALNSRLSYIECDNVIDAVFNANKFEGPILKECILGVYSCIRFSSFTDSYVAVTNNYANLSCNDFVTVKASNILFENNTVKNWGINNIASSTSTNLGVVGTFKANEDWQSYKSNITIKNNILPKLNLGCNATIYNNSVKFSCDVSRGSVLMYNNSVGSYLGDGTYSEVVLDSNSIFYNNTINGTVRITGSNVTLKDSYMNGILVKGNGVRNATIINNHVDGIINGRSFATGILYGAITVHSPEIFIRNNTIRGIITIKDSGNCELNYNTINGTIDIQSKSSIIRYNTINAPSDDYAVTIKTDNYYIGNEISNNRIYSKLYCGDRAVSYDENYLNFIEFNTPKIQIDMFVNNTVSNFDYGDNTTIEVKMGNVSGNVTIDADGEKYVVGLVKGTASLVLTKYKLGLNNVTVVYYDEINDIWAINHTNFTVNKVDFCPIELIYDDAEEGKHLAINIILPNDADGTIILTITDGVYTYDAEHDAIGGKNVINLYSLFKGKYNISATFISEKYVTNSSRGIINFVHKSVYVLTASNVVMDYKGGSKYKVLVTKDGRAVGVGEVVKITFNGVTKNVKTDKNGYATLTLDASPKTYAIKAICNGVTKSNKVTIKNILKASNISKKKAKKIKFSANLKNSKGNAIVGKKITFKFKGKTYSAKTNKKGVATITLKNLKVGKYTITSKYGACAVKNTIKINK